MFRRPSNNMEHRRSHILVTFFKNLCSDEFIGNPDQYRPFDGIKFNTPIEDLIQDYNTTAPDSEKETRANLSKEPSKDLLTLFAQVEGGKGLAVGVLPENGVGFDYGKVAVVFGGLRKYVVCLGVL